MQRDERAYLHDIIEACEAIGSAVSGLDIAAYRSNRLAHEYSDVDDSVVWLIAQHDVPVLRAECTALLENLGTEESL